MYFPISREISRIAKRQIAGRYDVAVFENLFPSMSDQASSVPDLRIQTKLGKGSCEVVVFAQDPNTSLSHLPLSHIQLLIAVWSDRYRDLGNREHIQ